MKINFFKLWRTAGIILFLLFAFLFVNDMSVHAQTTYGSCAPSSGDACGYLDDGCTLTGLCQIVAVFDEPGMEYPLLSPCAPNIFNPTQWWYCDFSAVSNALAAVTNYSGQSASGVTLWPLRITRNMLTDELIINYPPLNTNLLQVALIADSTATNTYAKTLRAWNILFGRDPTLTYDDLISQGFTNVAPARLVLDVLVMNINDLATYETNTAPPSDTSGGYAFTFSGMDSPSCTITDEASPFSVISMAQDTNFWTTVTWQSCSDHAYLVASTDILLGNIAWTNRVAIAPGQDISTSWTDTNSVGIVNRFYRVTRLWLSDSVGDSIPDWWRLFYFGSGQTTNALSCASCDPTGDGVVNLYAYLNGINPTNADTTAVSFIVTSPGNGTTVYP